MYVPAPVPVLVQAFGYDMVIDFPVVGRQVVKIPLEKVAKDGATMAVEEAWPLLQKRITGAVPGLLADMRPALRVEANLLMRQAEERATVAAVAIVGVLMASTWGAAWWIKKR